MKIKVICALCKKEEYVYKSRAKKYLTCSVKCLSKYNKGENNVECFICKKKFHVKKYRIKRLVNKENITCSKKCSNKMKKERYLGANNPNYKYDIDRNMFKNIDNENKAYILGLIASDGSVNENNSISIFLNKKDKEIIYLIKDVFCKDLPIFEKEKDLLGVVVNSKEMCDDICKLLKIQKNKKSNTVQFPKIDENMYWHFMRGFFDGDGSISKITETKRTPQCSISTNSKTMIDSIGKISNIPFWTNNKDSIQWYGNNALDFLHKMYENSTIKMKRKYELYLDIASWVPSVSYHRNWKNEYFKWAKTRKDAVAPKKIRASDSGYDLTILEKIKTVGDVEYYDTGIKINPNFGIYFIMVPRSSISKTGYMLANSIGIIDRTYVGNVIVALRKVDKNAPDLELPFRAAQIIPTPIIHADFVEVDEEELEKTDRGEGGFGSTGKS